jgi:multiple sugar transport system substrate-binding protein
VKKVILAILIFSSLLASLSGCKGNRTYENGELTIATFFESRFLELAARRYEELNEGVKITINVHSTEMGQQITDTEIYSQYINTALMGGLGEDIIDVRRLAWAYLADKGKLLDLNDKIEFTQGIYYQNIFDAYIYNGGRYVIPLNFDFDVFTFNGMYSNNSIPDTLTIDWLLSLTEEYPEPPLFRSSSGMSPTALAYRWFLLDFHKFIDIRAKKAYIDDDKFINLLESINSISHNLRGPEQGETALMLQIIQYNAFNSTGRVEDYKDLFLLGNNNSGGLFSTIEFLPAININSKNKELAVDFTQFLISEETQSSPELLCCPVNINAADYLARLTFEESQKLGYDVSNFNLENNIAIFNELAKRLTVVEYSDFSLNNFIYDEMVRYYNGEVSAQQAAKNLQSRVNTYLNE